MTRHDPDPGVVVDRESFFAFVRALVENRERAVRLEANQTSSPHGPDAGGWENASIEAYLDACLAWAQDRSIPEAPSWRLFAEILLSGKYYE